MIIGTRLYSTRGLKGASKSIFQSTAFKTPPLAHTKLSPTNRKNVMDQTTTSESLAKLTLAEAGPSSQPVSNSKPATGKKDQGKAKQGPKPNPSKSTKLRGMDRDSPEVRISKTLSWLLRHGAQGEGLAMRKDGYVKVDDLIAHPKLKAQNIDLEKIKAMVTADSKQRYDLRLESADGVKIMTYGDSASKPMTENVEAVGEVGQTAETNAPSTASGIWWIKARQGHSIKTVELELKPIASVTDIPTRMAVHGTSRSAWEAISKRGLSKMKRNHIHLAQNVAGQNVVSGMRSSSAILIYIDIQKAINAGIKFWLSENGVVLTEGDGQGFLDKKYFSKVVDTNHGELKGWDK